MRRGANAVGGAITRSRILLGWVVLGLGAVSVLLVSRNPERIFAGDPAAYRMRVAAIVEGGLPYVDVPFEHLPVMLAPMGVAWYLGGASSQSAYIVVFAASMTLTLAATAMIVGAVGDHLGVSSAGRRWVVLVAPLLPLVVFRNDPVAVLLAVVAMWVVATGRRGWWVWAVAGAFAKVWPAGLAPVTWRNKKVASLGVAASGLLALALTRVEGFTVARQAAGLHAETLVGGLVGLARTLGGGPAEVTVTTAAYLSVPTWTVVVNALAGVAVVAAGLWAVMRASGLRAALIATGTVVAGVMLTSPLLSLQYVLWLTPFIVLAETRRSHLWGFVLGVVTLGLAFGWADTILDDPLFYATVTLRNALVVSVAALLALEAVRGARSGSRNGRDTS